MMALDYDNIFSAFVLSGAGFALAILYFLFEVVYSKSFIANQHTKTTGRNKDILDFEMLALSTIRKTLAIKGMYKENGVMSKEIVWRMREMNDYMSRFLLNEKSPRQF